MTASKFFAASLVTLSTLGASAAFADGSIPFSGEHPFANETPSFSFRDRAAVQAEGERSVKQMATGENNGAAAVTATRLERADVRAEGQVALANGKVVTGEQSQAAAPAAQSALTRAEVRADARQAMRDGHMPAAGEFN